MQLKKFTIIGILLGFFLAPSFGQDFHYTQYFNSPLGVNPALAGQFNGTYRINGIYRDQYRGSATEAFGGFSLNIDSPIINGIRKQDWVGIGLRIEQATAGSAGQKINFFGLGAAYHLSLDKKQTRILSIGAQYGTGGYTYDVNDPNSFASFIVNGTLSQQANDFNRPSGSGGGSGGSNTEITGGSLSDLSAGLVYNIRNAKAGTDLKVGFGVEGILNPNRGASRPDKKGIGLNIFSSYDYTFSKRASLTSGAYFYSNKKANALNVNSIMNYKMKPGNEMTLHGGLGVRNVRAALVYLGMTIKGIRVGIGYDLDIASSTTATNSHKSIELGVSYIGKIFKKPEPKPIIYCPRL